MGIKDLEEYNSANPKLRSSAWSEAFFGVTTAGRSVLSSSNQHFLSFAGVGSDDAAGMSIIVPEDYCTGGEFGIYWVMDGTSSNQARIEVKLTQQGDLEGSYTDIDETLILLDDGQTTAAWKTQFTGYVPTALDLIPGKKLHIILNRNPGHVDDTLSDTFYLEAFVFKYYSKG